MVGHGNKPGILAGWSGFIALSLLLPAQAQVNLTSGTMTPAVGPYDQTCLRGAVVEGTDTIASPFGLSARRSREVLSYEQSMFPS